MGMMRLRPRLFKPAVLPASTGEPTVTLRSAICSSVGGVRAGPLVVFMLRLYARALSPVGVPAGFLSSQRNNARALPALVPTMVSGRDTAHECLILSRGFQILPHRSKFVGGPWKKVASRQSGALIAGEIKWKLHLKIQFLVQRLAPGQLPSDWDV